MKQRNGKRLLGKQGPLVTALLGLALLWPFLWLKAPAAPREPESGLIAPGLVYTRFDRNGVISHVLKLDLREKSLSIRSVKARGKETVRQLAQRLSDETTVLGAINGDYFRQESSAGIPYGVQVCDGRLTFAPMRRSMIGFGPTNEPYIGVVSLGAKVAFGPQAKQAQPAGWREVNGVNVLPEENAEPTGIYLYTPSFLKLKSHRTQGLVLVVEDMEPALQVGDVCRGVVARGEEGRRRVEVPEAGCLLYFTGEAAQKAAAEIRPGTPVALKIELPPIVGGVAQAIGGGPRLIRDGKKRIELDRESFESFHAMEISSRHPRSAIGYDQKKQTLFLVMVEGRHHRSQGMTFGELATFMADLGCYQAMGFDGGGSAGMYVGGKGMVSLTFGGEERSIANALLITAQRWPSAKRTAAAGPDRQAGLHGESAEVAGKP